jgi:hypothetical protein
LTQLHFHFLLVRLAEKKAAIGYTYEDSTPAMDKKEEESDDEDSDLDVETMDLGKSLSSQHVFCVVNLM